MRTEVALINTALELDYHQKLEPDVSDEIIMSLWNTPAEKSVRGASRGRTRGTSRGRIR